MTPRDVFFVPHRSYTERVVPLKMPLAEVPLNSEEFLRSVRDAPGNTRKLEDETGDGDPASFDWQYSRKKARVEIKHKENDFLRVARSGSRMGDGAMGANSAETVESQLARMMDSIEQLRLEGQEVRKEISQVKADAVKAKAEVKEMEAKIKEEMEKGEAKIKEEMGKGEANAKVGLEKVRAEIKEVKAEVKRATREVAIMRAGIEFPETCEMILAAIGAGLMETGGDGYEYEEACANEALRLKDLGRIRDKDQRLACQALQALYRTRSPMRKLRIINGYSSATPEEFEAYLYDRAGYYEINRVYPGINTILDDRARERLVRQWRLLYERG